jgi:signal recognition particle subunit SRP68
MHMKASHAEDNADKGITGSTRRHIISRLNKASKYAQQLVELLSDKAASASDIDLLEAQAYAYSLSGFEEFEKQSEGIKSSEVSPQRWIRCLTDYSAARVIYNALWKSTKNEVFKDILASTTDPSIRYAAYQHRIPRTVGVSAVSKKFFPREDAKLVASVEALDKEALAAEEPAEEGWLAESDCQVSHLTTYLGTKSSDSSSTPKTVTWRKRTANIVDAAIGQALASVNTASTELSNYLASCTSTTASKDKAAAYDDVLIASQDATDATRRAIDELEKEGIDEGDARMQDLRVTSLALNYDLIGWRVGRNRVLIGASDGMAFGPLPQQKPRRPRKDGKPWAEREEPTGRKLARLRERVALYDAILQSIDSVKELRGAARDAAFIAELDGQRAYFQALKCLNISHSHSLLSAPDRALALANRALSLSARAAASPQSPAPPASEPPKLTTTAAQTTALSIHLQNITAHYRGLVALSQLANNSATAAKAHLTNAAPLAENLNVYPASGFVDLGNLVTWPPRLKPVPVKPLFFDVAFNYIEYPGRATPVAEEKSQGLDEVETGEAEQKPVKKGWGFFGR